MRIEKKEDKGTTPKAYNIQVGFFLKCFFFLSMFWLSHNVRFVQFTDMLIHIHVCAFMYSDDYYQPERQIHFFLGKANKPKNKKKIESKELENEMNVCVQVSHQDIFHSVWTKEEKKVPFLSNVKPIDQQHLFAWLHSNLNRLSFHEWLDYSKADIRWILFKI